jgi:hypothetical protein
VAGCAVFSKQSKKRLITEKKNFGRKREVVLMEVQKALGITDMEIEINKDQRVRVEEQVENALEMEIERQGLENSKHAPTIIPGGTKPEPVALGNSGVMAQASGPLQVPR